MSTSSRDFIFTAFLYLCTGSLLVLICCPATISSLPTEAKNGDLFSQNNGNDHNSDNFLILAKSSAIRQPKEGDDKEDKGLSTMDYVYIGIGVLAALILISCLISYLFCECVKQIICLPCTILCCCCD